MKQMLRIAALLIVTIGVVAWLAAGRNMGWTKTSKGIPKVDPVTELTYQEEVKGFYPGVDLLAVTIVAAAALLGGSFLLRKKSNT